MWTRTLSYFPLALALCIKQGYALRCAYSRTTARVLDKAILKIIENLHRYKSEASTELCDSLI